MICAGVETSTNRCNAVVNRDADLYFRGLAPFTTSHKIMVLDRQLLKLSPNRFWAVV